MTRFRKCYEFRIYKDEEGFYIHKGWALHSKTRLSKGYILRLDLTVHPYENYSEVLPHLSVHKKGRLRRREKEGTPTGPGGVEVWEALRELWPEVERNIYRITPAGKHATLVVTAATPKLFRIYEFFLRNRLGYRTVYAGEIRKEL